MFCLWKVATTFLFTSYWLILATAQLITPGVIQTNVPWKAGHAAVFQDPYVIIYGGTADIGGNNTNVQGTKSVWVWHSQNGTWYDAQALSNNPGFSSQVFFQAVGLPSTDQTLALASNTTGGGSLLQKLDSTVWNWNSPTSTNPPAPASGYSMVLINNTIYTYGGVSVDANGNRMPGAVLNSLYYLDANSFLWSSGSNGPAVTDHSTCYIPSCNCLIAFGGTQTGDPSQPSRSVYIYDLGTHSWNLQVNPGSSNGAIPGPRRLHTATCLQDRMIIYGGGTTSPFDSDVWILDASKYPQLTWSRQEMANASLGPGSRMGHSAVLDASRKRIYIFGGWTSGNNNDRNMYILDIEKSSWSSVSPNGIPPSPSSSIPTSPSQTGGSSPTPAVNTTPIGAIAGGVAGGVLGLIALALALFFFLRRRKRQRQAEKEVLEKAAMEKDTDGHSQDEYYWRYGNNATSTNGGGYEDDYRTYSLSDPTHSDANLTTTPYGHKRVSKAWTGKTGTTSTRDSYARRSDHGDVQSSVMEMISSPSDSYYDLGTYNNLRNSRQSLQASKMLSATDLDKPGQIPNEYVLQKPNEFSVPASYFAAHNKNNNSNMNNSSVRIDHYSTSTNPSTTTTDGAPLSSSMEVLRSIKTNGSSALGSRNIKVTHAYAPRDHDNSNANSRTEDIQEGDDEDSLSLRDDNITTPPIQYIPGASKQFSIATTITSSAPSQVPSNMAVPLTHHQYPSSSVPVAQPVSPQLANKDNNGTGARVSIHSFRPLSHPQQQQQQQQQQCDDEALYDSVSPLDRLATLGQANTILHEERTADYFPSASAEDNKTMAPPTQALPTPLTTPPMAPFLSHPADTTNSTSTLTTTMNDTSSSTAGHNSTHNISSSTSSSTNNNNSQLLQKPQHLSVAGMLPRRYKVDKSKAPVIGPVNSILFVSKTDQDTLTPHVVIKSFGRREAWERECRTLIKLKSHHVVTLLEVLTIQDESQPSPISAALITPQSLDSALDQQLGDSARQSFLDHDGDDDHVKYVTVMERLDETLSSAIRRARPDQAKPQATHWSDQRTLSIARDIIECLVWCHDKGIAFCDLKPSNIMHNVDQPWKLIDFEASRTIGEECVGVITPRYCPPEVARATTYGLEGANGVVATASVDLWALGCVLYELETKRPLFASSIKDETILHFVSHPSSSTPILNNGLRWNEQKELEIPQLDRQVKNIHVRQLIKTLLSRDPIKRGSASQLLAHPYFN
ncbi:hypothetical protein BC941DRAFT_509768 [Chlamydoabsidia padenii]|nr:hypothetical protein BC941DRAFT_509768 [Chlamydoabsidia padenii]